VVAEMQARHADDTGDQGAEDPPQQRARYFVEVTAQHGDRLMTPRSTPPSSIARRWRTGALHLRPSLARSKPDRQRRERALGLELEIFDKLCNMASKPATICRAAAHAFGTLESRPP